MARIRKCVRCGRHDRVGDTWCCGDCLADPARKIEQVTVERVADGDYREMRRRLIADYNWAGEWPKLEGRL